jgi:hypothetical protein
MPSGFQMGLLPRRLLSPPTAQPFEKYDRYLVAPEAIGSANYNPFPADVYQLGYTLLYWFHVRSALSGELNL